MAGDNQVQLINARHAHQTVNLRDGVETDVGRRLLAEIRQDLARFDDSIQKVSDPTAKVLLEVGRAQLAGTVADLTGDTATSKRYGSQARQVPIGGQDLAQHSERVRTRFREASRAIADEVARVGLDLAEIGARLSLGRAVPEGLARDWDDRDLLGALARSGRTLNTASGKELGRAQASVESVQGKILQILKRVVAEVRVELRHEASRNPGRPVGVDVAATADGKWPARTHERSHSRDGGISL